MLSIIGFIVVAAIVIVLIVASLRSDDFGIARSATIKAPPEKIFPYLNELKLNQEWSPFERTDPNLKRSFSEPSSGVGATYDFVGNSHVGAGRITVVESVPHSRIVLRLAMLKPMKGENIVTYTLVPTGAETEVTWAMNGKQPFLARVMCVFINMEKMMRNSFDTGLATLKSIVEK